MCSLSPETDCFNVFAFTVENWPESHKPVEISDLRPCGPCVAQGIPRVQPGALRPLPTVPRSKFQGWVAPRLRKREKAGTRKD